MQTWHDLCEPGFWGVKIQREYTHAHKTSISFKQNMQAALRAVKDGEAIQKAAKVYSVPLFTLPDYLISEPNTCKIKQLNS